MKQYIFKVTIKEEYTKFWESIDEDSSLLTMPYKNEELTK